MFFKCAHPARFLAVQKPETVDRQDADFKVISYHLFCRKCGGEVSLSYVRTNDGVDAFLKKAVASAGGQENALAQATR